MTRSVLLCVLAWFVAGVTLAQSSGWQRIDEERGITLMRRDVEGCSLPAFRGLGVVRGGAAEIMAMMNDIDGVSKWAYGVDEARVLQQIDEASDVIYLRSDLPWPVRDRDMIVRRTVKMLEPGTEFEIRLACLPDRLPERSGIVRVRKCGSRFHLRRSSLARTKIDYIMRLDPGGFLPTWTATWVAKHTPLKTLVAIESQTASTRPQYVVAARKWSEGT